jgi:hypothetical protein
MRDIEDPKAPRPIRSEKKRAQEATPVRDADLDRHQHV